MVRLSFLLLMLFVGRALSQAATSVASQFSLSTSTTLPFPQATLDSSSTQSYINSKWGLSNGRIQTGASNLEFVDDPFANATTPGATNSSASGPVLQVQYPAGSYRNDNTGGAQFYAMWNSNGSTSAFQSMLVTYEVAFQADFDWVKGGKLPGLRGGPDQNDCSGGNQPDGTNCFSSRVMWRTNGAGEGMFVPFHAGALHGGFSCSVWKVYAYVPRVNGTCSDSGVECNDEYGISLNRGSFVFASGQCASYLLFSPCGYR